MSVATGPSASPSSATAITPSAHSALFSRSAYALAYVDELLADYSAHPLKSQQFVFERLLSLCGSSSSVAPHIALHSVRTLLSAVNFIELPPPPPGRKAITEQAANQINSLIIQFAIEEQPGRSALEIDGARLLFDLFVEEISARLQKESIVTTVEALYYRVLNSVSPVHQTILLTRLATGKSNSLISELLNQQLGVLFSFYIQKQNKCILRSEFVIGAVTKYLELESSRIDPLYAVNFLKQAATEGVHQYFYQPLIYRLLSKKTGTKYNQKDKLRSQIDEILNKQLLQSEVEYLKPYVMEAHRDPLRSLLIEIGPIIGCNLNSLLAAFKRSDVERDRARYFSPPSVAAAIIYLIDQVQRGFQRHASFERAGPGISDLSSGDGSQSWNGKAFAEAVMYMNHNLNWANVLFLLDDASFRVENRSGFKFFVDCFLSVYKARNFPVDFLFKEWAHPESQLSLLQNVVEHSDLFCLIDYPHHSVVQPTHALKNVPDEKDSNIANWCCLELTDILLKISERGHMPIVARILQPALPQYPDILLLAIFQIPSQISPQSLRERIIHALLPSFICQHPNAIAVLNVGWNSDVIPRERIHAMILEAFVAIYVKASDDQQKLAKILDVAHDLKPMGLSELLMSKELQFTIDLACLASKRDYLKLEKWLEDKYKEYKDTLIEMILSHIKRRAPPSIVSSAQGIGATLTLDTIKILVKFVHLHIAAIPGHPLFKQFEHIASQVFNVQQQMMMKDNSGRNSAVAGGSRGAGVGPGGGPPLFGSSGAGPPGPPQGLASQRTNSFSAGGMPGHYNPMAGRLDMGQHQPPGMGLMMGMGMPFSGTRDILKTVQPSANPPSSQMSPSSQMMRSAIQQPPQRQNSSSTPWHLLASAAPPVGRTPGPPTPGLDFKPQMPPTAAQPDFAPPRSTMFNMAGSAGSGLPYSASAGGGGAEDVHFPEDVQDEANSYFEKIYSLSGTLTVEELIRQLKAFKISSNPRDLKVLNCVVKNLFEEYRFFHEYPDRELKTTAEMYGGIIREGIISNVHFATAVRKVMESLQAEVGSNLWTFGLVALNACKSRLCSYPKVCQMISQNENFSKFPPDLYEYVMMGTRGEQPAQRAGQTAGQSGASSFNSLPGGIGTGAPTGDLGGRSTPPIWAASGLAASKSSAVGLANPRTGNSVLSYTNADTLLSATEKEGAEAEKPSEAVMDKIAFLFNNLSITNMQSKKEELSNMIKELGDPFIRWLAQYIVMKRVSIEQNFQPLYNQFVQAIGNTQLDNYIRRETFRNIKILLRTDKRQNAGANYSDRQLLKNLGMWLGAITIARSRPILLNDLDLKSLLLEAYYKGQSELLFVVPFISKILLSCSKTSIFSASSAWIRSILKILAELHNEPDLKINLKFEIEVLCKELCVDLNSLPIEGVLKDTDKLLRVPQQLSDLKILAPPEVPSPVPNQQRISAPGMEMGGGLTPAPGSQSKPTTPAPDAAGQGGETSAAAAALANAGPTNHFAYHDIDIMSIDGLTPHVKIATHLPLFQLHPHLKQCVRAALHHAIKELIGPVTERALKIAMTVTENLIRKDFAMDPDEKNMKIAAFYMMRAMTAGMAMITCRDPLATSIVGYLSQAFQSGRATSTNAEMQKMIDEATQTIAADNVELTTNFIVKTACEKATIEMEKRLEADYQKRIEARREGSEYRDEMAESKQQKLPAKIRIKPGTTNKANLAVYEQFTSRICGFKPSSGAEEASSASAAAELQRSMNQESLKEIDDFARNLATVVKDVDYIMSQSPCPQAKAFLAVGQIRDIIMKLATNPRDSAIALLLINCSVEMLLHAYHEHTAKSPADIEWSKRLMELFVGTMRVLLTQFSQQELTKRITMAMISIRSDYKWNMEAFEVIYKRQLLVSSLWDQSLAREMDSGAGQDATAFATRLVRSVTNGDVNKLPHFKEAFPLTCEQLYKIQQLRSATSGDFDRLSAASAFAAGSAASSQGAGGMDSPVGMPGMDSVIHSISRSEDGEMTGKVEMILREWIGLCYTPMAQRQPQEALANMIAVMHEHGVLASDDKITQFFRLCVEMCVDVSVKLLKSEQQTGAPSFHQATIVRQRCYYTLDAFVKLMALMIKHSDMSQAANKINLLKKLLNIVVGVLHMDHEVRRNDFNAMPYHRILISLFNELTGPDHGVALEQIAWSVLEAFGHALFALQPKRVPGFAFAWLDIVGHRNVIGRLLANTGLGETVDPAKTQATYTQLITCHLKFLAPFLRNIQIPKSIAVLYKGTLRVLLVILHDFPELLCEYHYVFCDMIPPNCVQLRNLVLSAYPRNMRLPDPFALNFKQVDGIPEMAIEPKSNLNMGQLIPDEVRTQLDKYLETRSQVDFLSTLPSLLQVSLQPGAKYNTTVINALVLYVGMKAINSLHERHQRISLYTIAHTAYMDIFQNLAVQLCTEGRYLLFNGIANQLRYPNAHTHYFSCVFLFLFLNSNCDAIQEQITRILFERLVALRPHPWGLLITFIELIKNPIYNFWKYEFTRCAPEIERLFQNVANTCVPASAQQPVPAQSVSSQAGAGELSSS